MSHAAEHLPLRVIGIGSPFGGDTIGWQAIERLRDEAELFPHGTELRALDRPGSTLIPLLETSRFVILIDAMQSGHSPGTVQRLQLNDLITDAEQPSSHSLGVAEALALAEALNVLPEKLLIYGIEEGGKESSEQWYSQLVEMLHQDMAV
jgi:hydrogenase maturation protease